MDSRAVARLCGAGFHRSFGGARSGALDLHAARELGCGRQPVTEAELEAMLATLPATLVGIRDGALLLVGFVGAFRRSELVALDAESVGDDLAGATISLKRSKTDQEGAGFAEALPFGSTPETCPVRALKAWLEAAGSRVGRSQVGRSARECAGRADRRVDRGEGGEASGAGRRRRQKFALATGGEHACSWLILHSERGTR